MRRTDGRRRAGVALLEAMIALVIITIAGTTMIALTSAAGKAVTHARAADGELRAASAYLDIVALWPRDDLDRHLGDRRQGPWRMHIDRPAPTIYVVTVLDSAGQRVLLRTALYRAEQADVRR
jgi:hypothetical protein